MLEISLREFTEQTASKAPVPGGGGVAALAGSLAASLGEMVTNLTAGKKRYASVEGEILSLRETLEDLRKELLNAIEEDAEAFLPLSKAYNLSAEDPDRENILEDCLRNAAQPPFRILQKCCRIVEIDERLAEIGSKLAVSDAASSVMLAHGAIYAARINVLVNTRLMKDRDYAEELDKKTEEMVSEYADRALRCYEKVERRLSNG